VGRRQDAHAQAGRDAGATPHTGTSDAIDHICRWRSCVALRRRFARDVVGWRCPNGTTHDSPGSVRRTADAILGHRGGPLQGALKGLANSYPSAFALGCSFRASLCAARATQGSGLVARSPGLSWLARSEQAPAADRFSTLRPIAAPWARLDARCPTRGPASAESLTTTTRRTQR